MMEMATDRYDTKALNKQITNQHSLKIETNVHQTFIILYRNIKQVCFARAASPNLELRRDMIANKQL